MHFGTPKDFEKECFTRVLKGQINLVQAIFPNNKVKGIYLDSLARKFLWEVGLDYSHGTGHGVGAYLNVHEGRVFGLFDILVKNKAATEEYIMIILINANAK